MTIARFAALLLSMMSALVQAEGLLVSGRVIDETGAALADAVVEVGSERLGVDAAGNFELPLQTPATLALRVSAPGHYAMLHTVQRSDFVGGRVLPDIRLVRKKSGRTLLLFAGDTMLARRYFEPRDGEPVLVRHGSVIEDGRKLLRHIRPYVELADFASLNLETQLSDEPLGNRVPKSVTFYSPAALAELLQWAGFDYVALGNNHLYDYREAGIDSTFAALDGTDLEYSGAGHDERQARAAAHADIDGRSHALLSYVAWAGTFSPTQVATDSKGGAAYGDTRSIAADLDALPRDSVAVVQVHGGVEYSSVPAISEQTRLRQAVDDGADVVIAHHAHLLQGFEVYRDRLIAYSMGNLLFDQYHYTTQLGMLLYVWMDGDRLHRAEAVPLHINGYMPTPATGQFRYAVLTRLARLSLGGACFSPSGLHAVVEGCDREASVPNGIRVPDSAGPVPIHVRKLGASPLGPVTVDSGGQPFRLGIDLSRRGDFEYARLFGAHDRTWMLGENTVLKTGDNNRLELRVPAGDSVRTGMKVFERIFTRSATATVSGRVRASGNVRLRVYLQRRRMAETLDEALANGALTEIGTWEGSASDWTDFVFDYHQPRIETRSLRLLIDVEDIGGDGATVALDDLAWIEWHTPWITGDKSQFATHVQLRP